MARYTQYVKCCLVKYYKTPKQEVPDLKDVAKKDWVACNEILVIQDNYESKDLEMFESVFTSESDFKSNVYQYVKEHPEVAENYVWKRIKELERRIAIQRGLYDP